MTEMKQAKRPKRNDQNETTLTCKRKRNETGETTVYSPIWQMADGSDSLSSALCSIFS